MKLVITLSGLHGTGKSTYAKKLAEEFELRLVSAGTIFRQIASEKRFSPKELTCIATKDKCIDHLIDERTIEEAKKGSVVLDGHLAGWMAKDYADIKILLTASTQVRVQRIAKRNHLSIKEAERQTLTIERLEMARWKSFYNINQANLSIYDITLNTELLPMESLVKILKEIIREYIKTSKRRMKRCPP